MGTNPPPEKPEVGGGDWVECGICGHNIGPGEARPTPEGCSICSTPSTSRQGFHHIRWHQPDSGASSPLNIISPPHAPIRPIQSTQLPHLQVSLGARRQLFKEEEPKGNICSECGKSFASNAKFQQHLLTHTGERPFACDTCNKAFSSKFKLVRHVLIHSDTREFICHICYKTFHRKDHLKNHAKVHNPVKRSVVSRYKCEREDCQKEYSSSLSFRKHMAIHSAQDGNLQCRMCNALFNDQQEVLQHLKIHSGSRSLKTQAEKKYKCNFCDRKFFTGKDVRRHLVVHTGDRDFECPNCSQKFGRKDHLVRHIKKSHTGAVKKRKRTTRSVGSIVQEVIGQSAPPPQPQPLQVPVPVPGPPPTSSSTQELEFALTDIEFPEEILSVADDNLLISIMDDPMTMVYFTPDDDPNNQHLPSHQPPPHPPQ